MKKILPVDVITAGIYYTLPDSLLKNFKSKFCSDDMYYFKNITMENGAKLTISYRKQFGYLSVRISAPKLVYGTNSTVLFYNDIDTIISRVNKVLFDAKIYANFSNFNISQIELCHNYICNSDIEKLQYIETFKARQLSRKSNKTYRSSVVFKNKSSRLTIYDKSAEMLVNSNFNYITPDTKKILRAEYKLNKNVLKRYAKDLSVDNILRSTNLQKVFLKENERANIFQKVLSYSQFYSILNKLLKDKTAKEKAKILAFYYNMNKDGETSTKNQYSPYLFRKYISIMKNNGYSPIHSFSAVNSIDFDNPFSATYRLTKEEIKQLIAKVKLNSSTHTKLTYTYFMSKVTKPLPLYLPCTFSKLIGFYNTS